MIDYYGEEKKFCIISDRLVGRLMALANCRGNSQLSRRIEMKSLLILISLWGVPAVTVFAQEPTGEQLLDRMDQVLSPKASQSTVVQTIETSSGGTRDFTYISYVGDFGASSLIRYQTPKRVKDEAFLMLNNADDIWAYFARTRRVRKLASHARKKKLMGSDFTYEDMGGGSRYKEEYVAKRLPDQDHKGETCYILELTPDPEQDPTYDRIICYLRKADYYPNRIDYYEKKDELLKILYLNDIKVIENNPTAMSMTMHNQQDGTKTIMVIKEITYDVKFEDDFFTERNLKP